LHGNSTMYLAEYWLLLAMTGVRVSKKIVEKTQKQYIDV
jgi:trans-aconitate methyltransferase